MDQSKGHSSQTPSQHLKPEISNYFDAAAVLHGNKPYAIISQSPDSMQARAIYTEAMNRGLAVVRHREIDNNTGIPNKDVVVLGKPDHVAEVMNSLSAQHHKKIHGPTDLLSHFRYNLSTQKPKENNASAVPNVTPVQTAPPSKGEYDLKKQVGDIYKEALNQKSAVVDRENRTQSAGLILHGLEKSKVHPEDQGNHFAAHEKVV